MGNLTGNAATDQQMVAITLKGVMATILWWGLVVVGPAGCRMLSVSALRLRFA